MTWDAPPEYIRAYMREWRANNRDRERAYRDAHRAKDPERARDSKARWARANPEKCRARAAVCRAVKAGKLVRPEQCPECGSDHHIQAHHDDYSKPLDVRWLCAQCHQRHHADQRAAV